MHLNCLPSSPDDTSSFIMPEVDRFLQNYKLDFKIIHVGKHSIIYAGQKLDTERKVIVKSIHNSKSHQQVKEALVLKTLKCVPGVITYLDHFHVRKNTMLLVMEHFGHGTLSDFIHINGFVSEQTAKIIFKQLVNTIRDCRNMNVVHKKIQCSNILLNFNTLKLKLIDFQSTTYPHNRKIKLKMSTAYAPPEYFHCNTINTDGLLVWRCGIILYNLLYGKKPFNSAFDIVNTPCALKKSNHSLDANIFIGWCLLKKPIHRMKLCEMLCHPWLTNVWL